MKKLKTIIIGVLAGVMILSGCAKNEGKTQTETDINPRPSNTTSQSGSSQSNENSTNTAGTNQQSDGNQTFPLNFKLVDDQKNSKK